MSGLLCWRGQPGVPHHSSCKQAAVPPAQTAGRSRVGTGPSPALLPRAGDSNIIYTIAGQPGVAAAATDGAVATTATLNFPYSVAFDSSGNLYILEAAIAARLYQVTPGGIIRDLTLGGNTFSSPTDVFTLANGSLILVMGNAHYACMYKSPTSCVTVAGTPNSMGNTGSGGAATSAQLKYPSSGVGHPTNPNRFWIAGGFRLARRQGPDRAPAQFDARTRPGPLPRTCLASR